MMPFPRLKTAAVMQYPAGRTLRFATDVVRFVDGSEQRYRDFERPLRTWAIRLELLDESEMAALESFFCAMQGRFGSFAFTDPQDGSEYPSCSLDQDSFEAVLTGEMRGRTALVVTENRI